MDGSSEKKFTFVVKGWASGVEREKIITILSDAIPAGTSMSVKENEVVIGIVVHNNEQSHEAEAREFYEYIEKCLVASGVHWAMNRIE